MKQALMDKDGYRPERRPKVCEVCERSTRANVRKTQRGTFCAQCRAIDKANSHGRDGRLTKETTR